jgi:antitoxin VapB
VPALAPGERIHPSTLADLQAEAKSGTCLDVGLTRRAPAEAILESVSLYIIRIMALSIKDPEADRLARELAARTGETLTQAVVTALRERLARHTGRTTAVPLSAELAAIRRRCAALPVLDARSADEILGYDHHGLPA